MMKKVLGVFITLSVIAATVLFCAAAVATLPYEINFSAGALTGWTTPDTSWVITSDNGVNVLSNTAGAWHEMKHTDTFSNFELNTQIKFTEANGDMQFYLRFRSQTEWPNTGYRLVWTKNEILVEKDTVDESYKTSRTYPAQAAFTTQAGVWYDLKIIADGSRMEYWIDGVKYIDYEDSYRADGMFALAVYNAKFLMRDIIITEPQEPATPTPEPTPEPVMPSRVTLTKSGSEFIVGIDGWNSTHRYQIWTYQEVTFGVFGTTEKQNQWILSHPYTLGSDRTEDGFTAEGSAITRHIDNFISIENSYIVAVKVIDGEGNFVGQYKDTYTPADIGEAVITKVTVDSVFADEKPIVKDIAADSPIQFVVTGNDVDYKVYTAKLDQISAPLTAAGAELNEFNWDISALAPGSYSVTLTLTSGASSNSRTVNFKLYDSTVAASSYGVVGGVTTVTPGTETETHYAINIGAADITGALFRYRISEPWGPTVLFSEPIEVTDGAIAQTNNNSILKGKYGIYQVTGYTYRNSVSSADDGFVKTVNYARPGGATLDVDVDEVTAGAGVIEKPTDNDIVIAASSSIPEPVYSFWRRDANGWVMIRGYDAAGTVTWQPHRVGLYTIQVRAKQAGGLTYEVLKNIEFNISQIGGDEIAEVTDISISDLSGAAARIPILITASATADSEDLLYKFIISNGYIYFVETAYSADPTYMWVPGKAGNYTISVLVKNQVSFGKYDGMESFTVSVD